MLWARDSDIKIMSVLRRMLRMQVVVVGWEKEELEELRDRELLRHQLMLNMSENS